VSGLTTDKWLMVLPRAQIVRSIFLCVLFSAKPTPKNREYSRTLHHNSHTLPTREVFFVMQRFAVVVCFVLATLAVSSVSASRKLVNEKVSRKIDLQTNVAKVTSDVTLRNLGDAAESSFDLHFTADEAVHIADLRAEVKGKELTISDPKHTEHG
jgi:hypothetical protein